MQKERKFATVIKTRIDGKKIDKFAKWWPKSGVNFPFV